MLVSIITRTKDRLKVLDRAKSSVLGQDYENIEWVLINDGGEDIPSTFFSGLESSLASFVYINVPKSIGMEAASNKAISRSNGELILIHDDDDDLNPKAISEMVTFLENNSVLSGVITNYNYKEECFSDGEWVTVSESEVKTLSSDCLLLIDILKNNIFPPISFMFYRRAYDTIRGYDERLSVLGDWDFNLRFLYCFRVGHLDKNLANYYVRSLNDLSSYSNSVVKDRCKHLRSHEVVINKYISEPASYDFPGLGGALLLEYRNKEQVSLLAEVSKNSISAILSFLSKLWSKVYGKRFKNIR
ncbi:CDP-glycerol glycerophosphotransferase [Saliniradius amylolyticus]|uniref:CDP-glycerol glycerophosphotransferase n=1 Tax=Saliniradius amylolyticus TaxID=2183582 RepID=A0A2S2E0S6_9ALTE|nr:glycosyltransferase [Saliniradius amylolyticus]AWL11226.1 CDP-glycerol glycerophosphotransferase [Saliniradius amylolyticus]